MQNIYEKLSYIQAHLDAPKGQYNAFGKYKYRSCEDILAALKPLLNQTKTVLTLSDELVTVQDRFYIKATAVLTDYEGKEGNGCVLASALAREEVTKKGMDGSQITGASSSYARKYALNGLFAIDDSHDSDATNKGDGEEPKHTQPAPAPTVIRSQPSQATPGPFDDVGPGDTIPDSDVKHKPAYKAKQAANTKVLLVTVNAVDKKEKVAHLVCQDKKTKSIIKATVFRTMGKSGEMNPLYDELHTGLIGQEVTVYGTYKESNNPKFPEPSFILSQVIAPNAGPMGDEPPPYDEDVPM